MKRVKVRGTRDLIPFKRYVDFFDTVRTHLLLYNFTEIHTPFFEYESVFVKNLGEMSDIVTKEMYYVSHAHSAMDDEKIVLRPELTASVMRAFLENNIDQLPWRVFSSGPAFRHERPQQGRFREFFQTTIEVIGAKQLTYDIELLSIVFSFFQKIIPGLFRLELNYLGTLEERAIYKKALYDYCYEKKTLFPAGYIEGLSEKNILRVLDHKSEGVKSLLETAPTIDRYFGEESKKALGSVTQGLEALAIPYKRNERLIRGLDYYTGLIFEFSTDLLGSQGAIAGGGRYDLLAEQMGSKKPVPSLGVGIGIDRVLLLLEGLDKSKNLPKKIKIGIFVERNQQYNQLCSQALIIERELIALGIVVIIYFDKESMKSALKRANQDRVDYVIIMRDIESKKYILKSMQEESEQKELTFEEIKKEIRGKN